MSQLVQSSSNGLGCYFMFCYYGPKRQTVLTFEERNWNHGTWQKHANSGDNITFFRTCCTLPNIPFTCIFSLCKLLSIFKFLTFHNYKLFITRRK